MYIFTDSYISWFSQVLLYKAVAAINRRTEKQTASSSAEDEAGS